ncbi:MAG: septum formation initiator family protein [Candidatus Doudnabacteria bacterium]|nr:septum formation initiator family protein [Candidatus Doudnabacteria bacterium]
MRTFSRNKTALILVILIAVASIFGKMHYSQWQKKRQIAAEIRALTAQQESLQQKNQELAESLAYLTSGNYKERIARQQLNLKKEGEVVYNFNEPQVAGATTEAPPEPKVGERVKEWWLYFFKP